MEISGEQKQQIAKIAGEHILQMVLLFGSAVTGRLHPQSDLDLAVRFRVRPSRVNYAELCHDLQNVFREHPVDVAILNFADPLFLKKITEHCRLLFGERSELNELKIYAFKRYRDHQPYFALERAYVERFLEETVGR